MNDRGSRKCEKKTTELINSIQQFFMFHSSTSFPFTTACYHASQHAAFKKTSCAELWTPCRLGSVHLHWLNWVRGDPQPPTHSHLSARQGARSGPRISTSGNYDTNEKSVNQRVTHRQEDGFDTLLQLQNSLSL